MEARESAPQRITLSNIFEEKLTRQTLSREKKS